METKEEPVKEKKGGKWGCIIGVIIVIIILLWIFSESVNLSEF